jgi:hypothetical protein
MTYQKFYSTHRTSDVTSCLRPLFNPAGGQVLESPVRTDRVKEKKKIR